MNHSDRDLLASPAEESTAFSDLKWLKPEEDSCKTQAGLHRDARYYFDDKMVVLRVETTLFRLPRAMLSSDSHFFESMLLLPQGHDNPQGETDRDPIEVIETDVVEFRRFLDVLYDIHGRSPLPTDKEWNADWGIDEWKSVLHVADKFIASQVKARAAEALEELIVDPFQRIVVGDRYDLPKRVWRYAGIFGLLLRRTPLTDDEADYLGSAAVLGFSRAWHACAFATPIKVLGNRTFVGPPSMRMVSRKELATFLNIPESEMPQY